MNDREEMFTEDTKQKCVLSKLKIRWGLLKLQRDWRGSILVKKGKIWKAQGYLGTKVLSLGYNSSVCWEPDKEWAEGGLILAVEASKDATFFFSSGGGSFKFTLREVLGEEKKFLNGKVTVSPVGAGEGKAKISPSIVTVGSKRSFKIIYVVGKSGIKPAGGLRLSMSGRTDWKQGKMTAMAGNKKMVINRKGSIYTLKVINSLLKPGNKIEILWKDNTVQTFSNPQHLITVMVDSEGKEIFNKMRKPLSIKIVGEKAAKIMLVSPATVKGGVPFNVVVKVMDRYNNHAVGYKGEVEIYCESRKVIIPKQGLLRFANAAVVLKGVIIEESGFYYLKACDKKKTLKGISNPIQCVRKVTKNYSIYWGDLHTHTNCSDGYGSPDFAYTYGRDVANLDFCAMSDHSEYTTRNSWAKLQRAAVRYHQPDKFITFLGFEAASCCAKEFADVPDADICVYYLEDYKPLYREKLMVSIKGKRALTFVKGGDLPFILEKLKGEKVLIIPHGLYTSADADHIFKEFGKPPMHVVEIYSEWGASEYYRNPFPPNPEKFGKVKGLAHNFCYQNILKKGYKLGVVGDGDDHNSMPGNLNILSHSNSPDLSYKPGLTAVLADSLSREKIFDAIRRRHTYATTGARIILNFRINGCIMGEEIRLKRSMPRKISVKVAGTTKIKQIDVIRNNIKIYTHKGTKKVEEFIYIDKEHITRNSCLYYYVRIIQVDKERAWSSPIWCTVKLNEKKQVPK